MAPDPHQGEDREDDQYTDVEKEGEEEDPGGGRVRGAESVDRGGQCGEQATDEAGHQVPEGDRSDQRGRAERGGQVEDERHPEQPEREHQQ
ncbi:hypothetical protein BJ964_004016 [Actinoplanes lobatus]|uniref:Uncharacterized protein n=1 Tax=Actinoplanes lobatus TaxID=113568 RepID=A0A7W7HFZ6_9ACTN|nr:hypothetical protein [Actinoplanes lobatus]